MSSMSSEHLGAFASGSSKAGPLTGVSHFLPTSKRIVQFSEGREPAPGDKVVYVDGTFDLFHTGHIEFLKRAKELGDYLLVGVHDDMVGRGLPVNDKADFIRQSMLSKGQIIRL